MKQEPKTENDKDISKDKALINQQKMMNKIKKNAGSLFEQHREVKELQKNITIIPIVNENDIDKNQVDDEQAVEKPKTCCKPGCIIREDNAQKGIWDGFISIVLVFVCVVSPLNIAFSYDSTGTGRESLDHIIDFLFFIDILVCFNAETMTDEFELISDRKQITINYLKGWFFIDTVSIIPFELFLQGDKYNKLVRIARIGRL